MSALDTPQELGRHAFDHRFETALMWLRQRRQELGHTGVVSLSQPLQLQLRGSKHRIGTLHGEVKRLKSVNTEHVFRSAPNRVQAGNLQRAAPVRTRNGLGHTKRNDDRLAAGGLEHPSRGNPTNSAWRSEGSGHRPQRPLGPWTGCRNPPSNATGPPTPSPRRTVGLAAFGIVELNITTATSQFERTRVHHSHLSSRAMRAR